MNDPLKDYTLDPAEIFSETKREKVYKSRKKMALEAFELRDYLDACECGGIKPKPNVSKTKAIHCDLFSIIAISYWYRPTCGYMDTPYHTGYKKDDIFWDVYQVDKKVTCLSGHESKDSVGCEDVFHIKHKDLSGNEHIRTFEECEELIEEFYEKWRGYED